MYCFCFKGVFLRVNNFKSSDTFNEYDALTDSEIHYHHMDNANMLSETSIIDYESIGSKKSNHYIDT